MRSVIAGGGLSGLTLAAHLAADASTSCPVLVVDDGSRPLTGMSWASWSNRPSLLDMAVSRRFDRIRIHAGGRTRTLGLGSYRYQVVHGTDLVAAVDRILARTPHVSMRSGHVERVDPAPLGASVVVDGSPIRARWVFDSVLGPVSPPPVDARLAFRGWRVRTERPVFDADTPTLFDFRTSQQEHACFVYVLPQDPHHALVEHTAFTSAQADEATVHAGQRSAVAEYLSEVVLAGPYQVLGEECSQLPLSATAPRRRSGDVLTIGTPAGMVKASTGYAYQRIQRDSMAITASLASYGHPFAIPGPAARHQLFDGALLDVVTHRPRQLERAFAGLFHGSCAEPALRFLDEDTSPAQETRLFSALPAVTYLTAVARRLHA